MRAFPVYTEVEKEAIYVPGNVMYVPLQDSAWAVSPATHLHGDCVAFRELVSLGVFQVEVKRCPGGCDVCWRWVYMGIKGFEGSDCELAASEEAIKSQGEGCFQHCAVMHVPLSCSAKEVEKLHRNGCGDWSVFLAQAVKLFALSPAPAE